MGRNLIDSDDEYRSGDHWVIDDRTGARIRSSDAVQEWNGTIVHREDAEQRHPQEYVRARADRQAARWPVRPEAPDRFIGSRQALTTAAASAGADLVALSSANGFDIGDRVILYLENGSAHITTVSNGADEILDEAGLPILDEYGAPIYDEPPPAVAGSIYLSEPLPWPIAEGAEVACYTDTPAQEEAL